MKTPNSPFTEKPLSLILEEAQNSSREQENRAQEMLDYHDRVAREAGLYDDLPDDFAPEPQTQQPIRVAGDRFDMQKYIKKQQGTLYDQPNPKSEPPKFAMTIPKGNNSFAATKQALATIAPTLRFLHDRTGIEHGVRFYRTPEGDIKMTDVYRGTIEGEIDLDQINIPHNATPAGRIHSHAHSSDKKYLQGSSASDRLKADSLVEESFMVPVDGPVTKTYKDHDAPVALHPAPFHFHPQYIIDEDAPGPQQKEGAQP